MKFKSLVALFLVCCAVPANAQKSEVDPVAVAYFDEIVDAYKKWKSLRVRSIVESKARHTRIENESWEWKRPYFVSHRSQSGKNNRLIISNGRKVFASYDGKADINSIPGEAALSLPFFSADPFYGALLAGKNPLQKGNNMTWYRTEFLGRTIKNGVVCDGIKLWGRAFDNGKLLFDQQAEVWFDAETRLMRAAKNVIAAPTAKTLWTRHSRVVSVEFNPEISTKTFELPAAPAPSTASAFEKDEDIYWNPAIKVGASPFPISGPDLNKKMRSLPNYRGKVLLVDFWATWCGPCVEEIPEVKRVYAKYQKQGFEVLGVSLDASEKDLRAFVKNEKLAWPQLFDGKEFKGAIPQKYGVQGIPFVLLIGKDGKVAAINPRGEKLEPAVQAALKK